MTKPSMLLSSLVLPTLVCHDDLRSSYVLTKLSARPKRETADIIILYRCVLAAMPEPDLCRQALGGDHGGIADVWAAQGQLPKLVIVCVYSNAQRAVIYTSAG